MIKKKYFISATIFCIVEFLLFLFVLFGTSPYSRYCSYAIVCLAFIFSLFFLRFKTKNYLTQFALFFTLIADYFLVLLKSDERLIAMISFSIAQIIYAIYVHLETNNKALNKVFIYFRLSLIVLVQIVSCLVLKNEVNALVLISLFYYTNLFTTVIMAFCNFKHMKLFAIGMLLFMLCDTIIGLQEVFNVYFQIGHNSLIYKVVFSKFNLIWLFYGPSQTLIALSSIIKTTN